MEIHWSVASERLANIKSFAMQIVARDYSLNEMKQKQIDDLIEAARYVSVTKRIS